ncbi:LOW QUALITY PROTEIN: HEPH-like protein [Mya arenaria]|uniref:HEPH-like protein n=1 Tax=Mya arenaria TaxID=6604 RepID=A0ABY7FDU0_MYAAR|nr:LOW QUALITY PROTEIN: HEPH-like protein [Mya arenaria]
MLICKRGKLNRAGRQRRVDREFFLNFLVVNENLSHYLTESINMFATSPATVDPEDEGFQLSNKIRGGSAINNALPTDPGKHIDKQIRMKHVTTKTNPSFIYVRNGSDFVGTIYTKTVFREFTDNTFTQMKPHPENLGVIGPFIRGNVGDTIEIHLKNMATFPLNIVPKNLPFADGSVINRALPTDPGKVRIYRYSIPYRSGPKRKQQKCIGTIYTSRVDPLKDAHSGLIGPMVICKTGTLDQDGQTTDSIKVEFATAFFIFDENLSHHSTANFAARAPARVDVADPDFMQSNLYYSINGYIYGNLNGLDMEDRGALVIRRTKIKIRWDVLEVYAGTYETVEMKAYNPGTWFFHCHVSTHVEAGMEGAYRVIPRFTNQ